jgi:hypothetical protein
MEAVYMDISAKKAWDKLGILLSTLCIVHCAGLLVLPLLLPALGALFHSPWIHRTFAVFILVITPMAFMPGYRRHGMTRVLVQAGIGIALVLTGVATDGLFSELTTHLCSVAGSVMLVSAHVQNLHHSRRSCC